MLRTPKANKIKAIIFDFGGPIMTEKNVHKIYNLYTKNNRLKKDALKKLIRRYFHKAHSGHFSSIADFMKKTKPDINITINELNDILKLRHSTMRVDKRMLASIKKLGKKYKIGLLTNFTSDLDRFLSKKFKIIHLFDEIINSYDIKIKKPHRRIYLIMLNKLKVKPNQAIFIDDKLINIQGAKRVGLKTILFKNYPDFKTNLNKLLSKYY